MADAPFRYDACTPWSDGKRRARDREGRLCVLLCGDAPGGRPIIGYQNFGSHFCHGWKINGSFHTFETSIDLVAPAIEPQPESDVDFVERVSANLAALDYDAPTLDRYARLARLGAGVKVAKPKRKMWFAETGYLKAPALEGFSGLVFETREQAEAWIGHNTNYFEPREIEI